MEKCFICSNILKTTGIGAGYARDSKNNKICYECCAKEDKKNLLNLPKKEKYMLYLSGDYVTNWPGTLKFKVRPKIGRHNIAGVRRDVWFNIGEKEFHGTQYGNNSEICYIERIGN